MDLEVSRRDFLRGASLALAGLLGSALAAHGATQEKKKDKPPKKDEAKAEDKPDKKQSDEPDNTSKDSRADEPRTCPQCGALMYRQGRTWTCETCGYSYVE